MKRLEIKILIQDKGAFLVQGISAPFFMIGLFNGIRLPNKNWMII
jgi:hypothetical protein